MQEYELERKRGPRARARRDTICVRARASLEFYRGDICPEVGDAQLPSRARFYHERPSLQPRLAGRPSAGLANFSYRAQILGKCTPTPSPNAPHVYFGVAGRALLDSASSIFFLRRILDYTLIL